MFGIVDSYQSLTYAGGLWEAWKALRRHLFLAPTRNSIPMHWRITNAIKALHPYATLDEVDTLSLTEMLGNLGIIQASHFWEGSRNTWRNFEERLVQLRNVPQWLHNLTSKFIILMNHATNITYDTQVNVELWV